MTQVSPKYPSGNFDVLSQVSESMGKESISARDNNEVDMELMNQMQQEGAEFNPNEMFPKEIKALLSVPENTHKNVNSFTPMSFNIGGAGNNFLGISPFTH